jgi:hypothetical protein
MMEQVADAIIETLEEIRTGYFVESASAYFDDAYGARTETKFGNPGMVHIQEYPFLFVDPVQDEPDIETIGLAGYDVRMHVLRIGFVIDISDYFDPTTTELAGLRTVTQVMDILNSQFRRFSKKTMSNLTNVRNLTISTTEYKPTLLSEDTFVMYGLITIGVQRQYNHEE